MLLCRPRQRRGAALVSTAVLLVSAGLSACSSPPPGPITGPTTGPSIGPSGSGSARPQGPPEDGSPLIGLAACGPPPSSIAAVADVPGLVVPAGLIVTKVSVSGPLTTVLGYIETTPIRVRQFYQSEPDLEILNIEDEIFEAEALVGRGEFRTYVKATAVCQDGSDVVAVVGPAGTGSLPTLVGS